MNQLGEFVHNARWHDELFIKLTAKKKKEHAEFDEMVKRGTKAWADVPDAADWVDDLRENYE